TRNTLSSPTTISTSQSTNSLNNRTCHPHGTPDLTVTTITVQELVRVLLAAANSVTARTVTISSTPTSHPTSENAVQLIQAPLCSSRPATTNMTTMSTSTVATLMGTTKLPSQSRNTTKLTNSLTNRSSPPPHPLPPSPRSASRLHKTLPRIFFHSLTRTQRKSLPTPRTLSVPAQTISTSPAQEQAKIKLVPGLHRLDRMIVLRIWK